MQVRKKALLLKLVQDAHLELIQLGKWLISVIKEEVVCSSRPQVRLYSLGNASESVFQCLLMSSSGYLCAVYNLKNCTASVVPHCH